MVFNLIRIGIFGKTEADTIEQFQNGYDFEEAFVAPFRPFKRQPAGEPGLDQPAHQSE
jgi:uncharacterized repeat protein (TIGR04138 family)